jgi:nuclear transport factor 2 (NTF2) superfamily protein
VTGFYHVCFVVPALKTAMEELQRGLGVKWSTPSSGQLGEWEYEIVFSREGPPFFELIEGPPGSPWDATTGPRCDHIGYWSRDLSHDKEEFAERGLAVDFDASPFGRPFAYHRLDSVGIRVELVDESLQAGFLETWAPTSPAMAPLELNPPDSRMTRMVEPATHASDAAQCRAVLIRFLAAIDHGRATDALNLFTEDASLTARGEKLQGREAISRFLGQREAETDRQTTHVIANETAGPAGDQRLELRATLILYVREPTGGYVVERILDTVQTFLRTGSDWRIHDRQLWPVHDQ